MSQAVAWTGYNKLLQLNAHAARHEQQEVLQATALLCVELLGAKVPRLAATVQAA